MMTPSERLGQGDVGVNTAMLFTRFQCLCPQRVQCLRPSCGPVTQRRRQMTRWMSTISCSKMMTIQCRSLTRSTVNPEHVSFVESCCEVFHLCGFCVEHLQVAAPSSTGK